MKEYLNNKKDEIVALQFDEFFHFKECFTK